MFWATTVETDLSLVPGSSTCSDVVTYMLTQHLQFEPGTTYNYSNLGYCVVGLVLRAAWATDVGGPIENNSYEDVVRAVLLDPAGITAQEIVHVRGRRRTQCGSRRGSS